MIGNVVIVETVGDPGDIMIGNVVIVETVGDPGAITVGGDKLGDDDGTKLTSAVDAVREKLLSAGYLCCCGKTAEVNAFKDPRRVMTRIRLTIFSGYFSACAEASDRSQCRRRPSMRCAGGVQRHNLQR